MQTKRQRAENWQSAFLITMFTLLPLQQQGVSKAKGSEILIIITVRDAMYLLVLSNSIQSIPLTPLIGFKLWSTFEFFCSRDFWYFLVFCILVGSSYISLMFESLMIFKTIGVFKFMYHMVIQFLFPWCYIHLK